MAKYIVLRNFRDKYTKEMYNKGQEIDVTVKRAKEMEANLKKYNDKFLERVVEDNK